MSRWDISPAGVQGVLGRTEAVAGEFDDQMRRMHTALDGGMSQSSSDLVTAALAGLAQAKQTDIQFVFTRTSAAVNGAAQATQHYLQGDLEMAANAQAAAAAAPEPRASMPGGGVLVR